MQLVDFISKSPKQEGFQNMIKHLNLFKQMQSELS